MEATTHQPEINAHDLVRYVHSRSSSSNGSEYDQTAIPPGFRFHPTEEELVDYYLRRMLQGHKLPIQLIPTVNLYSFDPWELPAIAAPARYQAAECWYFFVPRSSKFPHGERPTRQTKSGYWKATGTDTRLQAMSRVQVQERNHELRHDRHDHHHQYFSALRKTLVFYEGRAPRGNKTCWVMNEYRMDLASPPQPIQYNMIHPQNVESTICRLRLNRRMRPPANSMPAGASSFEAAGCGEELHHAGRPRPRDDVNIVSLHFATTSDNSTPSAAAAHPSNLHDVVPCYYSTHGPLHVQTLSSHDVRLMDLDATASQGILPLSQSTRPSSLHQQLHIQQLCASACPDMRLLEAGTSAPRMPSPGLGEAKGDNSLLSSSTLDDPFPRYDILYPNQTH